MHDYYTIQAELDYRRERASKGKPVKRRRVLDRTKVPFVGSRDELTWRAR